MSDDSTSPGGLFRAAGFAVPGDAAPASDERSTSVSPTGRPGSLFENAGFALPGVADPVSSQVATKPQGRGIVQALKDYPAHLLHGFIDTLATPGNVLASETPSTSESLIPGAVGLAGLSIGGGEYGGLGARAVAAKVGPSAQAVNKLVDAIGPENVPAAVERMQANPRLTPADVSDPVRTMAQGLIDPAQPAAQNALVTAVKSRVQSAPDAINSAYTRAMGANPDVGAMVEGLKERARAAGRKEIQPALENAGLVDTSPVIAAIDEKLKPGVNPLLDPGSKLPLSAEQQELARFKQQLVTGKGEQLFDAERLHRIQSDIGDRAYQLSTSSDPKDRLLGAQLRTMNEKLIDQIDAASGGAYRPARQKFKDAKDISAAFEAGFDTLKNRSGLAGALEDSPEAFAKWMKDATPEEVTARKLGTRADINQKINAVKNPALAGESITRIPYNRDKLKMLFGDQEADRLIRSMEDAREEALTNAKLLANSKTAETLAGQKALAVPKVAGGNPLQLVAPIGAELIGQGAGLPGVGFAASVASQGALMGARKLAQMNALARNTEFAKAAMATGPERNILINRLMAHPKVLRAAGQ